ncbi:MAG: phage portal protein [Pirellulales bacterium]
MILRWLIRWADAVARQEIKRLREERDKAEAAARVARAELELVAATLARDLARVKAETSVSHSSAGRTAAAMTDSPLAKALREADEMRERCRAAVSTLRASKSAAPAVIGGGPMFDSSGSRMALDAREELSKFRGWVFCAVRAIASRIAGLPIVIERNVSMPRGSKSAGEWQPIEGHPLQKLLDDPCPIMTRWSLIFSLVANLELTGRGLVLIDQDDDGNEILWPIPTSWATPKHEYGDPFARWEVRPTNSAGMQVVVRDDMIYAAYPDPADPLGAVSPLEACGLAVIADERLQTSQTVAFDNGITPGLALILGNVASPADANARPLLEKHQREQLINAVRTTYRGVLRSREPLILDALIRDVKPITTSPAEMDFMQSGRITKERILETFGVSEAILGNLIDANLASAEAAEGHFCKSTVAPKVELINRSLTEWLCPRYAKPNESLRIRLVLPEVVDRQNQRANVETLSRIGAITRNEARSMLEGLPPIAGGDVPLVPALLVPDAIN